jgi:hypothetical protein
MPPAFGAKTNVLCSLLMFLNSRPLYINTDFELGTLDLLHQGIMFAHKCNAR